MNKINRSIFLYLTIIVSYIDAQTIHIFGDGHALCFFANEQLQGSYVYANIPSVSIPVEIHWLGSGTMRAFGQNGFDVRNPLQQDIINGQVITKTGIPAQENDILVFVLGAIDIRDHICKQRDSSGQDINEIIENLVTHYCNTINLNRAYYKNITCVIMEVIPPFNDALYPQHPKLYGSLEDRIIITRLLNKRLKEACRKYNYLFLGTHDLYALENGMLNPALSDKGCHVAFAHNHPVRKRLVSMLIENNLLV